MHRRDFLLASAAALSLPLTAFAPDSARTGLWRGDLRNAHGYAVSSSASADTREIKLHRTWHGPICSPVLTNRGSHAVRIRQVVLFDLRHNLPAETELYGESFQMLSETVGTVGAPEVLGLGDARHYRIPQPADATAMVGVMTVTPPGRPTELLAFSSCNRFIGRFFLRGNRLQVVLDTEDLELAPGESWQLEEFLWLQGASRPMLLEQLARRIAVHHPPLQFRPEPTGWCSWPVLGTRMNSSTILKQVAEIPTTVPGLHFAQIDDGFEPKLGDWLKTKPAFGQSIGETLRDIRRTGMEPGIWLAPFVATADSHLFQQHPDWFIQQTDGSGPLRSDQVSFGGWHGGGWYALDGTHPGAQQFLTHLFHTIRTRWECRYFKLDALFWGALHGGRFHDRRATRIEAYRRGMEAIRRGAGEDAFILGCNHPIWPSLGLIHGSRSSNDISRKWERFRDDARQTLLRNWQNGRLWWNDPDTILLTGPLSRDEFQFHATAILASGGLVLAGDDVAKIPAERLEWLKKLLPPSGVAAEFADTSLRVGVLRSGEKTLYCCFNPDDTPSQGLLHLPRPARLHDFWSGADLGLQRGGYRYHLRPHSACVLVAG